MIIAENKNFMGAEDLLRKNGVEVFVLDDKECIKMMENFIKNNTNLWNEDIGEIGV